MTDEQHEHAKAPNPALKRLAPLIGTWDLTGRTLDAPTDNISGRVTISWFSGGFFVEQRGEMTFMGHTFQSLEILSYDPATDTFPAVVFSSMDGSPAAYHWDVQGDTVTHWTAGSRYTGTFNTDGTVLTGGWRPDNGITSTPGDTYDAVMTRVS